MRVADRRAVEGDRERITVVPESLDDLWHLTYVIEPGDLAAADTTRRIQRDDDRTRDTGGQREPMWVRLSVTDVEFAKFSNRLRVGGEIVDCSREDQLGFHHTLNVEAHDELTVEKVWQVDQLERLEDVGEVPEVVEALRHDRDPFAVALHGRPVGNVHAGRCSGVRR